MLQVGALPGRSPGVMINSCGSERLGGMRRGKAELAVSSRVGGPMAWVTE